MTVKELIEELQKLPPDKEIRHANTEYTPRGDRDYENSEPIIKNEEWGAYIYGSL